MVNHLSFDPSEPDAWINRGRSQSHAEQLAAIWRRFPDLPPDADADERLARLRARVAALRPFHDAITREQAEAREKNNFEFTAQLIADGRATEREHGILRGKQIHGYGWSQAIEYAEGYMHAVLAARYVEPQPGQSHEAYDNGFKAGGGDPSDIFDAGRRAFRIKPHRPPSTPLRHSRPLPSSWVKPTDTPRPTLWRRRLLILGSEEAGLQPSADTAAVLLPMLEDRSGAHETTALVITNGRLVDLRAIQSASAYLPEYHDQPPQLHEGDFDDILVAAPDSDLAAIDANATLLPLARTQERLRHTTLLRRAQFRIWLDRGLRHGEVQAAGHIRWGKTLHGLKGSLGEFTATYVGKCGKSHSILVSHAATGEPATAYFSADGSPLSPQIEVSNKRAVKPTIVMALRKFASSLELKTTSTN